MANMTQHSQVVVVVRRSWIATRNDVVDVKRVRIIEPAHFASFFLQLNLPTLSTNNHVSNVQKTLPS
jgi:hypothetical protein